MAVTVICRIMCKYMLILQEESNVRELVTCKVRRYYQMLTGLVFFSFRVSILVKAIIYHYNSKISFHHWTRSLAYNYFYIILDENHLVSLIVAELLLESQFLNSWNLKESYLSNYYSREDKESLSVLNSQSSPTTLDCCEVGNDPTLSSELFLKKPGNLKKFMLLGLDLSLFPLLSLLSPCVLMLLVCSVRVELDSDFSSNSGMADFLSTSLKLKGESSL